MADVCRHGDHLVERLLEAIDPVRGGFVLAGTRRRVDPASHLLLWQAHMASGVPGTGDAVIASLRAICRSALADPVGGGIYCSPVDDVPHLEKTLRGNALFLELLTWVWRVCRCPELRQCAEGIAGWAIAEMRVPGAGFAASIGTDGRDDEVRAACNGLMLVALVEAGSVFERREWLALAREVFDEIAAALADRGTSADLVDDHAMMSRAAIRLFEAFGKRRYLDHAASWAATLDAACRDEMDSGDCVSADGTLPSGEALLIGVLARLHALTGTSRYAERVKCLVEAFRDDILGSGVAGATAIANVRTAAQLVSIEVSGDPRLPETRELMRIALDCGLPDRLVLGPGAGGTPGERPQAHVRVGARRLAPIGDATQLGTILAAGGFTSQASRETVDSRRRRGIT